MSDFHVVPRSALGSRAAITSGGVTLRALPEGHVFQVLSNLGNTDARSALAARLDGASSAVRAGGPGQWFIVGDERKSRAEMASFFAGLQPDMFCVDQSSGRIRILAQGPMVERMLAKGTAVDLALVSFPVGLATTTLIGHIAAHITRIADDAFEIMVLRGFAESLWDDLARMSAEFR